MKRSTGALVVVAAAALPRLLVLTRERETILEEFVDKSDRFATTLVDHGTFGFLAGVPSAYTQPLYGWFLAGLYFPFGRSWLAVGIAQVVVAVATALVVFEIGSRLRSTGVGLVAALIATLHPYVIWHDVHLNREVLDGLVLAVLALCALAAYERRSLPARGADRRRRGNRDPRQRAAHPPPGRDRRVRRVEDRPGLAHGDGAGARGRAWPRSWSRPGSRGTRCRWAATRSRPTRARSGRRTTRTRARCSTTEAGSTTCPRCRAHRRGRSSQPTSRLRARRRRWTSARRCGSTATRSSTSGASDPGEKGLLALQATRMLWSPVPRESDESGSGTARLARRTIEPAFVIGLYALALVGFFVAPPHFVGLAVLMLSYNTLAAMVFAGTARYRTPWDFLLAILAAFALAAAWERVRRRRRAYAGASARS